MDLKHSLDWLTSLLPFLHSTVVLWCPNWRPNPSALPAGYVALKFPSDTTPRGQRFNVQLCHAVSIQSTDVWSNIRLENEVTRCNFPQSFLDELIKQNTKYDHMKMDIDLVSYPDYYKTCQGESFFSFSLYLHWSYIKRSTPTYWKRHERN